MPMNERHLRDEAAFLLDRISEWSAENLTDENVGSWYGHVEPSLERLRFILAALPPTPTDIAQTA